MKAQSKSNAARTARNLTAKTGIEHTIEPVEGGWAAKAKGVDAVYLSPTEYNERVAAERLDAIRAELVNASVPAEQINDPVAKIITNDGIRAGLSAREIAVRIREEWEDKAAQETAKQTIREAQAATAARKDAEALAEQEIREAEAGHAAWHAEREAERQAALRAYEAKLAEADTRRLTLREAAAAVLAAWDNGANLEDLDAPMAALHAAVHPTPRPRPTGTTAERGDTKQDQIIAMLKRETGASGPQMVDVTGWQPHTVRGFLTGLKKKGIQVEVLHRVKRTGPNRTGAQGAYTVYRIAA